jgi:hypothetical protein
MKSVRFVLEPEILGESKPQTGMWAATKKDTDPTAQASLEAILRRMNSQSSTEREHTFERSKMALRKNLEDLRFKPSFSDLKNWMWGFSKYLFPPQKCQVLTSFTASAGRASRTEREWEEAVKRAYATQAVHKHMVGSSSKRQLGSSSLKFSQDDLAYSRERHSNVTRSPVFSVDDHCHQTGAEAANQAEQTGSAGAAGSIWSNEPVALLPAQVVSVAQVIKPCLRQFTPTPPHAATIDVESADVLDHESDDASPKLQKSSSVAAVDAMMKGDGDGMISFGRWRHHKDAPLSLVKDMIERDLRDPGPCALYGPGGLDVIDHPLVSYYNSRLKKAQQSRNYGASSAPKLYPITASHVRLQCPLLQTPQVPTAVTFHMDQNGMFTATGFYTRTASMSSTIESGSPANDASDSAGEHEDARRDSGAGEFLTVPRPQFKRVDHRNPGQVMRPYTPDTGLNVLGINNGTIAPYHRNLIGYTSEKYQIDFCGAAPASGPAGPCAPDMSRQPPTARTDTPQLESTMQVEHIEDIQQRRIPQQRGYAMQRTGHHVRLTDYYRQPEQHVQAEPHAQRGPGQAPQEQHATEFAGRQGRQFNNPRRLPGPNVRQVTLVSARDADNAMWSDDESDDEGTPGTLQPSYTRRAIVPPPMTSLISKMVAESTSQSTATTKPHENEVRATATRSGNSSFNSTSVNTTGVLNTSTGPTPSHITPGTTASSGGRPIKSPAHAECIARRLADHLRRAIPDQDETSQISNISRGTGLKFRSALHTESFHAGSTIKLKTPKKQHYFPRGSSTLANSILSFITNSAYDIFLIRFANTPDLGYEEDKARSNG